MSRTSRLRRLLELRLLEEQNHASLLEQAKATLQQIDDALERARHRSQAGLGLVKQSIQTGDLHLRIAGVEEIACAKRIAQVLMSRRREAEHCIQRTRAQYLAKRIERHQAETLLQMCIRREAIEAQRRSQAALDEWHRMTHRQCTTRAGADPASAESRSN